jgi:PhnB protein
MTTVNVYLTFNGNCKEAFDFYKSVFGGEFPYVGTFRDMPQDAGMTMPETELDRIMHISLPVSKETMLMGSDTGGEWASRFSQGNNFSISINTDSKDKADHFFGGLSPGGQVIMPMNATFWGDYYGMLTDRFGINWMISYNAGRQSGVE